MVGGMSPEEIKIVQLSKRAEALSGEIQRLREELRKTKEKNKRLNEENHQLQRKGNVKLQKIANKKTKGKK